MNVNIVKDYFLAMLSSRFSEHFVAIAIKRMHIGVALLSEMRKYTLSIKIFRVENFRTKICPIIHLYKILSCPKVVTLKIFASTVHAQCNLTKATEIK